LDVTRFLHDSESHHAVLVEKFLLVTGNTSQKPKNEQLVLTVLKLCSIQLNKYNILVRGSTSTKESRSGGILHSTLYAVKDLQYSHT